VGDRRSACPSRVLLTSVIETLGRIINGSSDGTTGSRAHRSRSVVGVLGIGGGCSILWRLKCLGRAC